MDAYATFYVVQKPSYNVTIQTQISNFYCFLAQMENIYQFWIVDVIDYVSAKLPMIVLRLQQNLKVNHAYFTNLTYGGLKLIRFWCAQCLC